MGLARILLGYAVALGATGVAFGAARISERARDLGDMSLEQLSNVVVSTVSGREEPLSRALGSIYVITGEDIRRSGATSLGEALRLAPNLQVARAGASGWAITARGFNDTLSNKLLVLLDGRSLYTPVFAGVFWDAQDLVLEDVEHIEVISGPGGVLWGANAVNGVINITTKRAAETQRAIVAVGGGDAEARLTGRYGGAFGGGHYRAYVQGTHLRDTELPDGTSQLDEIDRLQAGFRLDGTSGTHEFTVQGDGYASEGEEDPDPQRLRGVNVLGRYARTIGERDRLTAQAYFDHTRRQAEKLDTADLQIEHVLAPRGRNGLLWGAGLRRMRDRIENSAAFAFLPADKVLTSWNLYLQDEIAIREDLGVTVGARLDRNSYTGIEVLPSARVGWRPGADHLVWGAVSRAVRAPARLDRELFLPGEPPFLLAGGSDFQSEVSWVYELGYRGQPAPRLSWAATAFWHDHAKQRSLAPGPEGATIENDVEGSTRGVETWAGFQVTDRWRLSGGYTYLGKDLHPEEGAVDLQSPAGHGADPKQWLKLRSALDIGRSAELDLSLRYYDDLVEIDVSDYTAVDGRIGWTVSPRVELSILVRNLFDAAHVEWDPGAELDRTFFAKAVVRF